jgi:hypothetical protein
VVCRAVSNSPRREIERALRPVANTREEGRSVFGVGFRPSRQQELIGRCCTFRFGHRRFALIKRGKDLRMNGAVFRIVRDFD